MRTLILAALVGMFSLAVYAADVTGKWTAQVPGRGRGGAAENTFVFKVEGKKLTGTTNMGRGGDAEIRDGKVDGDQISFTVISSFGGAEISYKGKVDGDTIAFSRTMEGEDYGTPPTKFTATRAK